MASKANPTLAEEQAIAKEISLTSNLESERSLAGDLFAEKNDGPLEDSTDHPVFKLRIDCITFKQVDNSVKKQTTFTCYASDSNEDAMVTDPPNQEDQQTRSNRLFKKRQIQNIDQQPSDLKMDVDQKPAPQQVNDKPVNQPEVITISDDEDSFILIPQLFTVYTESNNLPHVRKTDKAHEVLKLLQHYPEDQDGNIVEKDTAFQFKSAMKEKPQKNKEEIDNKKERTIQVFDIPLYTEKKTIQNSFSLLDPTIKRNICNNCGNPDHLYAGCNIKKCPNKRNNTVKAAWKERTKLTVQNKNRSYAQVVKSNATPTNPHNRNNAQNQNKNNPREKNPAHINNIKGTTSYSPNNKSQLRGNQMGSTNQNKNLSDKQ
ncbi:hypothetical protein RclHR1_26480002 [Rhizophagus clarus]|uniref:Uncharacterized protein n=1 Tax=Rhizophagus clarus TaxID=94130 RepID=A0A2Z6R0L6_9GLOM|nr:hypothetical protein RclHR1_26480002 [Rhizophagus clarus]GES91266.1 hypothetical protein RCL_jg2384.t1 [Rhizophagus clarus]